MAEKFLTPETPGLTEKEPLTFFRIDNLLNEIVNGDFSLNELKERQAQARESLGAISYEDIYNDVNFDQRIKNILNVDLDKKLSDLDLLSVENFEDFKEEFKEDLKHKLYTILEHVNSNDNELKKLLTNHLNNYKLDVDKWINSALIGYIKSSDVYNKGQLYTQDEVDTIVRNATKGMVKTDGSTPFRSPQYGQDPQSSRHLTTRRYVDKLMNLHKSETDPHNINTILKNNLKRYALASEVLKASETYTRWQIDSIIDKLIKEAIDVYSVKNPKFEDLNNLLKKIYDEKYVKFDGSVPFEAPQQGEDAIQDQDLVTLRQLNQYVRELKELIEKQGCTWKTSGPVQTTVGFVEDESELPARMTMQEILDAIFYGKRISITVPDSEADGNTFDIVVCINGDLSEVEYAELFKNGELLQRIDVSEFEETGCVTITTEMDSDAEFEFKVHYKNGSEQSESATTKLAFPVFVGIIPKWKWGSTVTFKYLENLVTADPFNNKFYDVPRDLTELAHQYDFELDEPVKLIIALPADYPDLKSMTNGVQTFNVTAFDTKNFNITYQTTFRIAGQNKQYKLYIYKQPLVSLNSEVTFQF